MKSKAKLYEWIDRFNNNDLSGEEYLQLVHLLNSDLRVREEVLLDRELNSMLKDKELLDLRRKLKNICETRGKRGIDINKYILIAAALLIILTLGYTVSYLTMSLQHHNQKKSHYNTDFSDRVNTPILYFPTQQHDEGYSFSGSEIHTNKGHSGRENFREGLAGSYQPNKTFEYLVGITYRSTGFSLTSPERAARFNLEESILFSWKTGRPVKTSLYISDNHGVLRYESDFNNYPLVQLKAGFLGYGLFYYKILQEDEVVCFEKFTVH